MRYFLSIILLLFSTTIVHTQEIKPQDHVALAINFLKNPKIEPEYIRFLSYYNYQDDDPKIYIILTRFWINSLHFQRDITFPEPVPNSDGKLFWIDLRDYGWSAAAWQSVARREPYFREPFVDPLIRNLIGGTQESKTDHSLSVEAIVRADWFFRETIESDRSTSYYDLLFAKQRFKYVEEDYKEYYGGGMVQGKYYAPGYYTKTKKVFKFVDFPKNEKQLEEFLGIDIAEDFIKKSGINTKNGAVVEGGEKGISIVARQNRLIVRTQGQFGSYYKTFDVKETSGRRDFTETLEVDFEYDAGEILYDLPDGGQGTFLVNAKGDRLEVADNRFATDSSDLKLDARVRTPGSCMICHESGYIRPQNYVEEMIKAGVDIKFKDKQRKQDAHAFFLNWDRKLKFDQVGQEDFIARTTLLNLNGDFTKPNESFTPGQKSTLIKKWRDQYDAPVDIKTAAAEVGLSEAKFRTIVKNSTKARPLTLLRGLTMPRKTWEVDGYEEVNKQMIIYEAKNR